MKKFAIAAVFAAIPVLAFAAPAATTAAQTGCGASGAQCSMMSAAADHSQCASVQAAPSFARPERDGRK
jgi:hypothetical protein